MLFASVSIMLSSMSAATATKLFFLISETTQGSKFKNYYDIALDSVYISTGNDVTRYFRSAANAATFLENELATSKFASL